MIYLGDNVVPSVCHHCILNAVCVTFLLNLKKTTVIKFYISFVHTQKKKQTKKAKNSFSFLFA